MNQMWFRWMIVHTLLAHIWLFEAVNWSKLGLKRSREHMEMHSQPSWDINSICQLISYFVCPIRGLFSVDFSVLFLYTMLTFDGGFRTTIKNLKKKPLPTQHKSFDDKNKRKSNKSWAKKAANNWAEKLKMTILFCLFSSPRLIVEDFSPHNFIMCCAENL